MPKIFVSYRRADSQIITERIHDRLVGAFGDNNVFLDVDNIPAGAHWKDVLSTKLHESDILLVIIGNKWLESLSERQNEDDYVRFEVETGLKRGSTMIVVPVLVNNADPALFSQLPASLQDLANRQIIKVRPNPDFHRDMDDLISNLSSNSGVRRWNIDWKWLVGAILIPIIAALITIVPSFFRQNGGTTIPTEAIEVTDEASPPTASEAPSSVPSDTALPVPPTATTIFTHMPPTLTSTSSNIPTTIATTEIIPDYPCEAQIIAQQGSYATIISEIRIRPSSTSSLSAAPANPQSIGTLVSIVRKDEVNSSQDWYQIYTPDSEYLGWIEGIHLELSDTCPN